MVAETETASAVPDTLKWSFAILLFLGGLVGFYFYADHSLLLRVIAILAVGGTALFVVSTTASGRLALGFVRDARTEVRKVVWPTRKETVQTTMIVLGAVCVAALFLWGWTQCSRSPPVRCSEMEPKHLMAKRWYVVHAYSGFEQQVLRMLKDRIERSPFGEYFGDVLVPTEEVVEMRDGQKRKSDRKFFPGYVLVNMEMNDDTWHLVKGVPKVMGFIGGTSDRPAPITDAEADTILQRVQEGTEKPRPKVLFEPGEVVRVTDGPFNDFSGVVEEVNYEKSRLRVAVLIFGRSTPVELEFGQVEKE